MDRRGTLLWFGFIICCIDWVRVGTAFIFFFLNETDFLEVNIN